MYGITSPHLRATFRHFIFCVLDRNMVKKKSEMKVSSRDGQMLINTFYYTWMLSLHLVYILNWSISLISFFNWLAYPWSARADGKCWRMAPYWYGAAASTQQTVVSRWAPVQVRRRNCDILLDTGVFSALQLLGLHGVEAYILLQALFTDAGNT